ncbi:MAG: hypothetical protein HYX92_12355 [Chloroflexi bacterium]|nr:hypothetical protein [Chloroflexota bacterium]
MNRTARCPGFMGERGSSLLELMVAMAGSGVLLVIFTSMIAGAIRIPVKTASELTAAQQIQNATLMVSEDASMAHSFTPGVEPEYGTFNSTWYELTGSSPVPISVTYSWDNQRMLRVLTRDAEVGPAHAVIDKVLNYGDVTFQYTAPSWTYNPATKGWTYVEGKVTFSMITTHEAGAEFPNTVFSANLTADRRQQIDLPAPLPATLPAPAPPANQVDFRIAGNPTLVTGTYRSGSGSDLRYDDTSYYVARGAGSPRTVVWTATSEVIDYTQITDITVQLTGRADKAGVSLEFYIYNPSDPAHTDGGYSPSADAADNYASAATDKTTTFDFTDDDITYVNSLASKVITIKVRATYSSVFDLSADKLVFKVAGTPAATFSRDYFLEVDPTIEAGSYVSGNYTSMSQDDTNYYVVGQVSYNTQWVAISEPIALDTISSVEVRFISRVTRGNPVLKLFVFNPANGGDGYSATPNGQVTLTSTSDVLVSFFLTQAERDYVKTLFPKEVRIRVKVEGVSGDGNYNFQADQLVFRVKP